MINELYGCDNNTNTNTTSTTSTTTTTTSNNNNMACSDIYGLNHLLRLFGNYIYNIYDKAKIYIIQFMLFFFNILHLCI